MFALPPPATRALIVANVLVYLLWRYTGAPFFDQLALWPIATSMFAPWQVITYSFMHGSGEHIFFNMFALFMFGPALEQFWGSRRFLVFYFASVLAAALAQLLVSSLAGGDYPTVGASGGIFGLLLAFALYFPRQRVAIFGLIPMPAWLFVSLYAVIELVLGVTNTQAGVGINPKIATRCRGK